MKNPPQMEWIQHSKESWKVVNTIIPEMKIELITLFFNKNGNPNKWFATIMGTINLSFNENSLDLDIVQHKCEVALVEITRRLNKTLENVHV